MGGHVVAHRGHVPTITLPRGSGCRCHRCRAVRCRRGVGAGAARPLGGAARAVRAGACGRLVARLGADRAPCLRRRALRLADRAGVRAVARAGTGVRHHPAADVRRSRLRAAASRRADRRSARRGRGGARGTARRRGGAALAGHAFRGPGAAPPPGRHGRRRGCGGRAGAAGGRGRDAGALRDSGEQCFRCRRDRTRRRVGDPGRRRRGRRRGVAGTAARPAAATARAAGDPAAGVPLPAAGAVRPAVAVGDPRGGRRRGLPPRRWP